MHHLAQAIASMPLCHEAVRLFHGRGGCFAGEEHLTLDAFPPALVLTSFKAMTEAELAEVGGLLQARWSALAARRRDRHTVDGRQRARSPPRA